eukprot:TRINITY_DN5153_c0_g1_i1.p1 TRINITY_DN5153_c0_g1~~TRINITY_DN5153_c0_g1_i1.p1  ORF type:complete len:606 (-),score=172.07 TRINITY_DN5153_c0_g1_i1:55-1872(-)
MLRVGWRGTSRSLQYKTHEQRRRIHIPGFSREEERFDADIIPTGQSNPIAQIKDIDTPESIQRKAASAKSAQRAWREVELHDRATIIGRFVRELELRRDGIANTISVESGKPLAAAIAEVDATIKHIGSILDQGASVLYPNNLSKKPSLGIERHRDPLGTIGFISTYVNSLLTPAKILAPALLAGNTVLFKPSEHAAVMGQEIVRLLHECGVPKQVLPYIVGGSEVGGYILSAPLDSLTFVGRSATGQAIKRRLGDSNIPLQLHLSAKNAVYIREDVSVDEVVDHIIDGAFLNNGQDCASIERIYVQHQADAFAYALTKKLVRLLEADPDQSLGRMTTSHGIDLIQNLVDDAVRRGAKIEIGGKRGHPGYYPPTVLTNVDHTMRISSEEILGPVVTITKVGPDSEGVAMVNDCRYGLAASIFTHDENAFREISSQLNVGSVFWNMSPVVPDTLSWAGRKNSGTGNMSGPECLTSFTKSKSVMINKQKLEKFKSKIEIPPENSDESELARALALEDINLNSVGLEDAPFDPLSDDANEREMHQYFESVRDEFREMQVYEMGRDITVERMRERKRMAMESSVQEMEWADQRKRELAQKKMNEPLANE